MRPLILLSNDDGYLSPHIHALADAIDAAGFADTLMVAPERERSAASHTITLHKPLRLKAQAPGRYALSGTPVDCVYVGLLELSARRPPAVVVSGINRGYNLGSDVFYSGTVGAAVEGALRGVSAVAVSADPRIDRGPVMARAVAFSVALLRSLVDRPLPPRTVLNVNVPHGDGAGYRWTALGERKYSDDVNERRDPRGRPYYWIGGGAIEGAIVPGTDGAAIADGVISVTPLHLDLTARALLADRAGCAARWPVDGYEALAPEETAP